MRFFIDRCAGTRIAAWLRAQGHDVIESHILGSDPGDRALLEHAARDSRVLITIDTDFGQLVFLHKLRHAGLIRLPDVPWMTRIEILRDILDRFDKELEAGAIVTVRGGRIRISTSPE